MSSTSFILTVAASIEGFYEDEEEDDTELDDDEEEDDEFRI